MSEQETIETLQGQIAALKGAREVAEDINKEIVEALDIIFKTVNPTSDLEGRVETLEFDVRNMPDEYELTDTVVESEELKNKVEELVKESLRNVTLRLEDV